MIRLLARLVSRQVCTHPPKEKSHEEADLPPPLNQQGEQIPSISHARSSINASPPDMEELAADPWPDPSAQALVVLFTALAQRRAQAGRMPGGNP